MMHGEIKVRWSEEDSEYVATNSNYPSLSWLELDPVSAVAGLVRLMEDEGLDL
jgi:hypothetical protein